VLVVRGQRGRGTGLGEMGRKTLVTCSCCRRRYTILYSAMAWHAMRNMLIAR